MQQTLFRAASPNFDVRTFAARHNIAENCIWLKGEAGNRGPLPNSGFTLLIADAEELAEHLLQRAKPLYCAFPTSGWLEYHYNRAPAV
jgi:hypothetical protein